MVKCTINGQTVEVKEGTTVIEAMHQEGMKIAHYCWHPGLSVAGVCRLCMVEIQGNPRLQVGCNTVVTEGMNINNTSDKVKEAVQWGLDFHLINHPLDCPVCDQAGECGLQDQYMEFGQYDSIMAEPKQKKHKVVDLGPTVVLDSERCILCSRCVRFTTEVSKTNELGIFNRGDHSEVGTHEGTSLDNNYSLNTVDICPVGALTSKDFRFKQRVWYLKEQKTICNGCSTGCNIKVYFNTEGFFRVKPVYNEQVNGYWMCDQGRDIYKFANKQARYQGGKRYNQGQWVTDEAPGHVAMQASKVIAQNKNKTALILTGQYTVEEYEIAIQSFLASVGNSIGIKNIYHWNSHISEINNFDGTLLRGDRNPNTKGLIKVFEKYNIQTQVEDLEKAIEAGQIDTAIVAGPEDLTYYKQSNQKMVSLISALKNIVWLQSTINPELEEKVKSNLFIIPMKSYLEKSGTFINFNGIEQSFRAVTTVMSQALTLGQAIGLMMGDQKAVLPAAETAADHAVKPFVQESRPASQVMAEERKKNEFIYKRGATNER